MEKPIWLKGETSAVQQPQMQSLPSLSCCSPRVSAGALPAGPNHTYPRSQKQWAGPIPGPMAYQGLLLPSVFQLF